MSSDDVDQITNVLNFYALALDTARWPLFDQIFTADVDADYGPAMHWRDLASFKRDFQAFHDPLDATQHMITNHQVKVQGDRAHAFTYGNWRLIRHAAEGAGDLWEGTGWYDDRLVRTAAGWRVQDRVCRVIWWEGNPRVGDTIPGARFEPGVVSLRAEAAAGRIRYFGAK